MCDEEIVSLYRWSLYLLNAGRGDVLLLLNKLILVFIFTILWKSIDRWFAQLVVLASAVVYLGNYMVYQPHVRFEVNSGKSALAAAYLFATISKSHILVDTLYRREVLIWNGVQLPLSFSWIQESLSLCSYCLEFLWLHWLVIWAVSFDRRLF